MTDKGNHRPQDNAPAADQPLDEVLAEFIRRRDAGEKLDVESLCVARPDLADALRSYADGEEYFREMALDDSMAGASALAETVRPGAGRDTDASMTGRSFGNYRVVRQLGQGGMGAVYLAEDATLQRQVALKIPKFTHADGPDARERFFREARSAAALNHPHICPVFHADESDGIPYIAMAFIDGQPLSRFVGTDEFHDQRRVAEITRQVADALQHAHDKGFIHRDLKPGNIMLGHDGQPIVTDFGLARRLVPDQESRITQEGQLIGTPAYMSPEQIGGDLDRVSSSTDIYALGVVLFELLTDRLPFQGSVPEVIASALRSEPPKPSSLRADVAPELESLCLQLLQKKPGRRPASMQDVSTRLQEWLDRTTPESVTRQAASKQLQAELASEREGIVKMIRAGKFEAALKRLKSLSRRKEPAAVEFREWAIEQIPRVKARPAQAKRNEPEMLKMAQEWMAKHDYAQTIQILRSIPELYRSEAAEELLREATELQEEIDDLLLDLKKCVKKRIYDGIDDNLNRLLVLKPGNQFAKNLHQKLQGYRGGRGKGRPYRFDKQGRLLAVNEENFWSRAMILSAIVGLSVFGLMTWAITIYLKSGDRTVAVEIDPAWLKEHGANLTLSVDGDEHTLSSPELDLTISVGEHGFAVRDNGRLIHNPQTFIIEKEGRQVLHINATGMNLKGWAPPTNPAATNDQTAGGQSPPYLSLTGTPRTPIPDGPLGLVKTFDLGAGGVGTVSVSPDGRLVAAGGSGRKLQVWDIETDKLLWSGQLGSYPALIGHCLFIRNGTQILAAGSSARLEKFDARNGTMLLRYEGHFQQDSPASSSTIAMLDQLPDGSGFVTISKDGTFAVWDFDSSKPKQYIDLSKESSFLHGGLADDGIVVSRLRDSKDEIRLLSSQTGETIRTYGGTRFPNVAAVHLNSNSFLRCQYGNPDLEFVDVTTGNVERSYKTPKGHVQSARYTPDGRHAIVATSEPAIRIWEIASGKEIAAYPQTRRSSTLTCSPDGRFLFFGDNFEDDNGATDARVHVWRLPRDVWTKDGDATTSIPDGQSRPYADSTGGQGQSYLSNSVGMQFVKIAAGSFSMGSPSVELHESKYFAPQCDVTISRSYYMQTTEVTQQQWSEVFKTRPWEQMPNTTTGPDEPVTCIKWGDALEFCRRLTDMEREAGKLAQSSRYTLPTEAQWEYACRAGTTTRFSFGDDDKMLDDYGWYRDNARPVEEGGTPQAVRTRLANPWGIFDMHGNVWEWCRDFYIEPLPGGTDPIIDKPDGDRKLRVFRGGSWANHRSYLESASRNAEGESFSSPQLGFRVVRIDSP